jgi:hypothetical protein
MRKSPVVETEATNGVNAGVKAAGTDNVTKMRGTEGKCGRDIKGRARRAASWMIGFPMWKEGTRRRSGKQ